MRKPFTSPQILVFDNIDDTTHGCQQSHEGAATQQGVFVGVSPMIAIAVGVHCHSGDYQHPWKKYEQGKAVSGGREISGSSN